MIMFALFAFKIAEIVKSTKILRNLMQITKQTIHYLILLVKRIEPGILTFTVKSKLITSHESHILVLYNCPSSSFRYSKFKHNKTNDI